MDERFGPGRPSILSVMAGDGPLPETVEEIEELIERFNSLPFEERDRILEGAGIARIPPSPWEQLTDGIEMPPAAPVTSAVEEAAAAVPVLESFRMIRAFLGDGKKLTAKGNLTVADAKALGEQLGDVGLEWRAELGQSVRSADDLPSMQFLLRWARAAGAVRVQHGRMTATDSWARLRPLAAAAKAAEPLFKKGALRLDSGDREWDRALDTVIDEGLPHLMAILWAVADPFPYEMLLEGAAEACDMMLTWAAGADDWRMDRYRWRLDRLIEILGRAGLVERSGEQVQPRSFGLVDKRGGELALTPVGRAVLRPHLQESGYPVAEAGELADGPLSALLAMVPEWHPARTNAEFDCWVQRQGAGVAVGALADAVAGGYTDPQVPVALVHLAGRLPAPFDEQAVRRLVDTPARGHATNWLLARGHDDVVIDEPSMMRAGIEMLAVAAGGEPEEFLEFIDQIEDPMGFVAACAAVPGAASERVLRTIASLHPDPAVATAARRAAMSRGPSGPGRKRDHRAARRRRRR